MLGSNLAFPSSVNPSTVANAGSRLGPSLLREEDSHEDFPALPSKADHFGGLSSGLDASLTPASFPPLGSPSFAPSTALPPAAGGKDDNRFGLAGLMEVNRSVEKVKGNSPSLS